MDDKTKRTLEEINMELSRISSAMWEIARKDRFNWLGALGIIGGIIIGALLGSKVL